MGNSAIEARLNGSAEMLAARNQQKMRNRNNGSLSIFAVVLALLIPQLFGATLRARGSGALSDMQFQYTEAERAELLQTMVFLSCERDQPLRERMSQLSPYDNLLLQTWRVSGDRDLLSASNAIGSASSIDLADNHPDVYREFMDAFNTTLRTYWNHPLTDAERVKKAAYWDLLAETDLRLLTEHLSDHIHSLSFISGSLSAVRWLSTSPSEQERAYKCLTVKGSTHR